MGTNTGTRGRGDAGTFNINGESGMLRFALFVRNVIVISAAVSALGLAAAVSASDAPVTITVAPDPVRIVRSEGVQKLSLDFLVTNTGSVPLDITEVRLTAFDDKGALVTRREINAMGMCPSIATLPNATVEPGKTVILFNPFQSLPLGMELKTLRYAFQFVPKESKTEISAEVTVHPVPNLVKTPLSLPLKGKVLVWDGWDFYAHHRRLDLASPFVVQLGVKHNITRYGLDFMMVDPAGSTFRGRGEQLEDYYIFGKPVLAPASGIVVDCVGQRPDSPIGQWLVDYDELARTKNLKLLGGNYIIIDHGNGEFSSFNHLKNGSVRVKAGDRLSAGQAIAEVGNSGDSAEPHLHYQLRESAEVDCEGIPAEFRNFRRYYGSSSVKVKMGDVDTGDIVEAF